MKTLTLAMLERGRACSDQRKLFKERFGESVEITEDLCVLNAADFSFGWAMIKLLPRAADDKAWKDTKEELGPFSNECNARIKGARNFLEIARIQEALSERRKQVLARHFARAWLSLPEDYEP